MLENFNPSDLPPQNDGVKAEPFKMPDMKELPSFEGKNDGAVARNIEPLPEINDLPPLDTKDALTPISEESTTELKDKGYPRSVIDNIGSEEEKAIYEKADVAPKEVNGRDALVKTNIDVGAEDDFGRTNLERMEQGLAPLDSNGNPIELHHVGQKMDSPLAELTRDEHRGKGNDTVLHNKQKESEINREDFAKERAEHWKARAEQIKFEMNA